MGSLGSGGWDRIRNARSLLEGLGWGCACERQNEDGAGLGKDSLGPDTDWTVWPTPRGALEQRLPLGGPAPGSRDQALAPYCVQLLARGCLGWGRAGAGNSWGLFGWMLGPLVKGELSGIPPRLLRAPAEEWAVASSSERSTGSSFAWHCYSTVTLCRITFRSVVNAHGSQDLCDFPSMESPLVPSSCTGDLGVTEFHHYPVPTWWKVRMLKKIQWLF